jgi:hypothetical protein
MSYFGVSLCSRGKKRWRAQINVRGNYHFLGSYSDEEEAARAVDA